MRWQWPGWYICGQRESTATVALLLPNQTSALRSTNGFVVLPTPPPAAEESGVQGEAAGWRALAPATPPRLGGYATRHLPTFFMKLVLAQAALCGKPHSDGQSGAASKNGAEVGEAQVRQRGLGDRFLSYVSRRRRHQPHAGVSATKLNVPLARTFCAGAPRTETQQKAGKPPQKLHLCVSETGGDVSADRARPCCGAAPQVAEPNAQNEVTYRIIVYFFEVGAPTRFE